MRRLIAATLLAAPLLLPLARPASADRSQAVAAIEEGDRLIAQRNIDGAIAAYSRAVEADPKWGTAYGKRGYAKRIATRWDQALEDLTTAVALEPMTTEWRLQRAQAYLNADRPIEALEEAEALYKLAPQDPTNLCLLGWALIASGDVDKGLEHQAKALQLSGNNPALRMRFVGLRLKCDWAALIDEMNVAIAARAGGSGAYFYRVIALVESGQYDKAAEAVAQAEQVSRGTISYMCRVYLASTPAAGAHYKPDQALKDAKLAAEGTTQSDVLTTWARAMFLTGHVTDCLDLLVTKGRRTDFDTLFWLGAAHWKLGQFAEARQVLLDARRRNPYLLKRAEAIEGFKDFAASIDRELANEGGQQADRGRLGYELATHLMTVAEIETLVRRYQFSRAVAEYEKLLPTLKSEARKAEVAARLPEVRGMAGAHAKIQDAVRKAPGKVKTKVGKMDLTLQKSDDLRFDFVIQGGDGKFPWAYLDPIAYHDLAVAQSLSAEEIFGVGCLLWDAGQAPAATRLFEEAVKKKADLKKNLASFVARKRGIPAPGDGFVLFRNSYVTAEEKANLEKGLVRFQGQWVTAKDREHLAKGEIQIDGKWLPGEEAELLKRGYRKYKDKWMPREDYDALRGQWAEAYTEETAHYIVKTNESEQFAKDLAVLVEAAYGEYRTYYDGAEPKLSGKEKMTLHAYRTYEDYRKYCVETNAEDHLNAAGFARSDSNVVVGWNKTSNRQQFLQTMVHECAHLYFFRVCPMARPASWYAEAMATYFEGFSYDGKTYKFNFMSESRLPFVRDAMKGGRHIPLKDMMAGNALALINSDSQKALLFYAQCWALNYYLCQTENKAYRAAYAEYRKAVASGQTKDLLEFFPDAAALERDWMQFVTGL
jgi:Flp pilus assembly protein TadD